MRRENDPLPGFRFVLELGFIEAGAFNECTGLGTETKTLEYREGGRNGSVLKFPDVGAVSNIVLKRGVLGGSGADLLFRWHDDVRRGAFDEGDNPNRRPSNPDEDIANRVAIVLQDEMGTEVTRWVLHRALPVKWTGPDLKAQSGDLAMEILELACEGVEVA